MLLAKQVGKLEKTNLHNPWNNTLFTVSINELQRDTSKKKS